jgi:hypothetical protein
MNKLSVVDKAIFRGFVDQIGKRLDGAQPDEIKNTFGLRTDQDPRTRQSNGRLDGVSTIDHVRKIG